MGDFFGSIYCWLEDFFGLELADYLWGLSSPEQSTNMYIGIGLSMFGISAFMMVLYYYIIDHPKLGNWWGWLIFCAVNAAINFIVAWQWVLKDYYDGMMVKKSATTGQEEDLLISSSDIVAFGITNMIDAIVVYIILSYLFRWWSDDCRHAPL